MGEIGASSEEFSLATAVYACVAISTISKQRWLVERLGWRSFVQLSLALFILGSGICAANGSYPTFLVGRAVMGLGGAAFMTSARVMVNLIPPSQSHPVLFMSLASGSFLLLYILQRSQYDFFSDATMLAAGLGCGAFALYYFFRTLHRHERPLIGLKALRHPRYISGVALFTLCYVLLGANNYMLPVLMQRTLGFAWQTVGLIQTFGLMSAMAAWLIMAWAIPKWPGPKKFFIGGFAALAIFGWQLSRISGDVSLWIDVMPALACNGIFLMFVMGTTAMQTFRDVQHHETVLSHAQQLKNMVAQFGMAVGIASSTLMLQWRTTGHYSVLSTRFAIGDTIYTQMLHDLSQLLASRGAGPQTDAMATLHLAQILGQQSSLLACLDYFFVIAIVGAIGAGVMLFQRLMR